MWVHGGHVPANSLSGKKPNSLKASTAGVQKPVRSAAGLSETRWLVSAEPTTSAIVD